jgi:hypothetical protein
MDGKNQEQIDKHGSWRFDSIVWAFLLIGTGLGSIPLWFLPGAEGSTWRFLVLLALVTVPSGAFCGAIIGLVLALGKKTGSGLNAREEQRSCEDLPGPTPRRKGVYWDELDDPPTAAQLNWWSRIRIKGHKRFLLRGALVTGLPVSAMWLAVSLFVDWVLERGWDLTWAFPVVWMLLVLLLYRQLWRVNESRYVSTTKNNAPV